MSSVDLERSEVQGNNSEWTKVVKAGAKCVAHANTGYEAATAQDFVIPPISLPLWSVEDRL